MKKKIFKDFVKLFDSLSSAVQLLVGYDNMQLSGEPTQDEEKQKGIIEQCTLADELSVTDDLEKAGSFNMDGLFEEIEENFYKHRDSIDIYTTTMLRDFIYIVPYYKKTKENIGYGIDITYCVNFLQNSLDKPYSECSKEQQYLLKTQELLYLFKIRLDALCLDFNVDIMTLQRNAGLDIYYRGTASTCAIYHEYKKQLNEIWEKERISEADGAKNIKEYKSFADIFTVNDWNKYLKALTECNPKLLNYNKTHNSYEFIGNSRNEKGCIGQYFKQLKAKGKIKSDVNRDKLAEVLSGGLINFSISGASIDNESSKYKEIYEPQLSSIIKS